MDVGTESLDGTAGLGSLIPRLVRTEEVVGEGVAVELGREDTSTPGQ